MISLLISKEYPARIPRKQLDFLYAKAMEAGDLKHGAIVQIIFTGDSEIRDLNRKYRGLDEITDILTFQSEFPHPQYCGDIVIDIEQAERQKGKASLQKELLVLFIHGLMHLIGYDHIRKDDRLRMMAKEKEYLSFIKE